MLRIMLLLQLVPRSAARSLLHPGGASILATRVLRAPVASMATSGGVKQRDERLRVAKLLQSGSDLVGQTVTVKGWVRTVRQQKTFAFVELNDGSSLKGVQVGVAQSPPSEPAACACRWCTQGPPWHSQVVASEGMDSYSVVDQLSTGKSPCHLTQHLPNSALSLALRLAAVARRRISLPPQVPPSRSPA